MFFLEKDLILLNIPRCASSTTEYAIVKSNLSYQYIIPNDPKVSKNPKVADIIMSSTDTSKEDFYDELSTKVMIPHIHVKLNDMYKNFGVHESVGITRDYLDKFLSTLRYFYDFAITANIPLVKPVDEVTAEFIIDAFNIEFFNISESKEEDTSFAVERLIKPEAIEFATPFNFPVIFNSAKWWTSGHKLTHEFDIKELDKFKTFIENRYNTEITLVDKNRDTHVDFPNLIVNSKLRDHIWNTVEKKYHVKKLF